MIFECCQPHDRAVFLRVLLRRRHSLGVIIDPEVTFGRNGNRALHHAVDYAMTSLHVAMHEDYLATDPDPELVSMLIDGFGANPSVTNALGLTPLGVLLASAATMDLQSFKGNAIAYANWRSRVDKTHRILSRCERDTAIAMSQQHRLGASSSLRDLDSEMLQKIASFSLEDVVRDEGD